MQRVSQFDRLPLTGLHVLGESQTYSNHMEKTDYTLCGWFIMLWFHVLLILWCPWWAACSEHTMCAHSATYYMYKCAVTCFFYQSHQFHHPVAILIIITAVSSSTREPPWCHFTPSCCLPAVLSACLSLSLHDVSLAPSKPFVCVRVRVHVPVCGCMYVRRHTLTHTYGCVWSHQFPPPVHQIWFLSELFIAVEVHSTLCDASWPVFLLPLWKGSVRRLKVISSGVCFRVCVCPCSLSMVVFQESSTLFPTVLQGSFSWGELALC